MTGWYNSWNCVHTAGQDVAAHVSDYGHCSCNVGMGSLWDVYVVFCVEHFSSSLLTEEYFSFIIFVFFYLRVVFCCSFIYLFIFFLTNCDLPVSVLPSRPADVFQGPGSSFGP